jgi:cellulose synthase/poly-beta-1,6-N-acetylglucosamine synthase-like glycosyltransferase
MSSTIITPLLLSGFAASTLQSFHNVDAAADIWNHVNPQFWQYVLPGCDALGYIGCTGTNVCIRARCLAVAGWFPEYTITEDYALSMELKLAGFRGRYLPEYLAVGSFYVMYNCSHAFSVFYVIYNCSHAFSNIKCV